MRKLCLKFGVPSIRIKIIQGKKGSGTFLLTAIVGARLLNPVKQ